MKRQGDTSETSDADLREMFERARITPRLPEDVRARARTRALAFLTGPPTSPLSATGRIRCVRLAFAVSPAFIAGATGAAVGVIATLRGRAPRTQS